ncbi:hypothetical protein WBJ53_26055 [Spirosoma sp. SC4-14]|uniref:hypothetical protein n=1 Tax=Spirosoma sp. SC4-14 TaxID=3128900 RepID=UPI0030CEA60E
MSEQITLVRLADNQPESFPKEQAEHLLRIQKEMGQSSYKLPDDSVPTANADNGQPSDSVNSEPGKRGSSKTGG